jgi:hypothetical protein
MKHYLSKTMIIVIIIFLLFNVNLLTTIRGADETQLLPSNENYMIKLEDNYEKNSKSNFNSQLTRGLNTFETKAWWDLWTEFPGRYEPFFDVKEIVDFGQTAWGLTTADFNNDNELDFAVSWSSSPWTHSTISIFYNNGKSRFKQENVLTITEPELCYIDDLDSGDYDNDGDIDLLFTYSDRWGNDGNGTIALLANKGTNVFDDYIIIANLTPTSKTARINPQISTADYDNDGDIDFLVGDNSGLVELYKNNGHGYFTSASISDFGERMSWGLSSADFDNDGDIDFIVTQNEYPNPDAGIIYLKWNDGSQSCFNHSNYLKIADIPPEASFFTGVNLGFGSLFCLDYNNDDLMDFFFSGGDSIFLYIQKENVVFDCFTICRLPSPKDKGSLSGWNNDDLRKGGIASGDFNNDNIEDLIIGGVQGTVRLLYNKQVFVDIINPDRYCLIQNNIVNRISLPPIRKFYKQGTSFVIGDIIIQVKPLIDLSKVNFYLNGRLIHVDESEPFEWDWSSLSFGRYKVKAIGYDLEGKNVGYDDTIVWKFF